ncbi:hypothetical protein SAMN05444141_11341 [Pseudovibrio denitrificans]|uniref:Uncharacterized protein n=2 Tax=Pseudovibrio denitrificans TaxID=258256 RepID=A0A1I7DYR4_9HYPH|nr:hypothetical protein SAMN05444141_11341 [Pseudovibrio denitrificans]
MAGECAGALSLLPEDSAPPEFSLTDTEPLSAEQLAQICADQMGSKEYKKQVHSYRESTAFIERLHELSPELLCIGSCIALAEQEEPDELRGSRPVL